MHNQSADRPPDVVDLGSPALPFDDAGIANLAARFRIEGRLGQDQFHFLARGRTAYQFALTYDANQVGGGAPAGHRDHK